MNNCSKCGKLKPDKNGNGKCTCKKLSDCKNEIKCVHCGQPKNLFSNKPIVCYCQCHRYNYNIDCGYQTQYVQPIQQQPITLPMQSSTNFLNNSNSQWLILVLPAACCCILLIFVIIFISVLNNNAYYNGYSFYGK